MFIHLGESCVIRKKDMIAVFDIENTSTSAITREYLNKAGKRRQVIYVTEDMPKSFVVTDRAVYISSLSSQTLIRRFSHNDGELASLGIKNSDFN